MIWYAEKRAKYLKMSFRASIKRRAGDNRQPQRSPYKTGFARRSAFCPRNAPEHLPVRVKLISGSISYARGFPTVQPYSLHQTYALSESKQYPTSTAISATRLARCLFTFVELGGCLGVSPCRVCCSTG